MVTWTRQLSGSLWRLRTAWQPGHRQGFPWEHLGWNGAAVKGSSRLRPVMVQACRGPTATEPTAACWPIRETTRCTATGCCKTGVSTCTYAARTPGANDTGSRGRPGALQEPEQLFCSFIPNGARRKTSPVSSGLLANEAALVSLAAALNGASWKMSWVSELGGWATGWDMTGHWTLFRSAGDMLGCSFSVLFSSAACSPFTLGAPCRSVKPKKQKECQANDDRQMDRQWRW